VGGAMLSVICCSFAGDEKGRWGEFCGAKVAAMLGGA
jgi:hypothetical protein